MDIWTSTSHTKNNLMSIQHNKYKKLAHLLYQEERFSPLKLIQTRTREKGTEKERGQGIALAITCSQNDENTEALSRQMRLGL